MSLAITTPPTVEPVTLDQVKAALRLTTTADDTLITGLITPARVFAEKVTRKSLVSKGYTLTLDRFPWPHDPIMLPAPPVSAVGAITYLDTTGATQTWASDEYIVGLAQIPAVIVLVPGNTYPSTLRASGLATVTIPFTAGPASGALQIDLSTALQGVIQLACHFYEHPEAVSAERLEEMPLGIRALLGANKTYVF